MGHFENGARRPSDPPPDSREDIAELRKAKPQPASHTYNLDRFHKLPPLQEGESADEKRKHAETMRDADRRYELIRERAQHLDVRYKQVWGKLWDVREAQWNRVKAKYPALRTLDLPALNKKGNEMLADPKTEKDMTFIAVVSQWMEELKAVYEGTGHDTIAACDLATAPGAPGTLWGKLDTYRQRRDELFAALDRTLDRYEKVADLSAALSPQNEAAAEAPPTRRAIAQRMEISDADLARVREAVRRLPGDGTWVQLRGHLAPAEWDIVKVIGQEFRELAAKAAIGAEDQRRLAPKNPQELLAFIGEIEESRPSVPPTAAPASAPPAAPTKAPPAPPKTPASAPPPAPTSAPAPAPAPKAAPSGKPAPVPSVPAAKPEAKKKVKATPPGVPAAAKVGMLGALVNAFRGAWKSVRLPSWPPAAPSSILETSNGAGDRSASPEPKADARPTLAPSDSTAEEREHLEARSMLEKGSAVRVPSDAQLLEGINVYRREKERFDDLRVEADEAVERYVAGGGTAEETAKAVTAYAEGIQNMRALPVFQEGSAPALLRLSNETSKLTDDDLAALMEERRTLMDEDLRMRDVVQKFSAFGDVRQSLLREEDPESMERALSGWNALDPAVKQFVNEVNAKLRRYRLMYDTDGFFRGIIRVREKGEKPSVSIHAGFSSAVKEAWAALKSPPSDGESRAFFDLTFRNCQGKVYVQEDSSVNAWKELADAATTYAWDAQRGAMVKEAAVEERKEKRGDLAAEEKPTAQ